MSESKFSMAQKLARVQKNLMMCEIQDYSLDSLINLIFKKCSEENLTFWFNFYEHEVVLNLRDISHENYELNIRQYYDTLDDIEKVKLQVLDNAFLLTEDKETLENNDASSAETRETQLIGSTKITPKPIRKAIETIQSKGVPVTKEGIRNHVSWGQLSTDQRIKCTNYLEEMGDSE